MNSDWPFPDKFHLRWHTSSTVVRVSTVLVMKAIIRFAQKIQTKNMECLRKVVWERPKGIPLVTVSNHVSCIDDPAIPSLIPGALRGAFSSNRVRWIPAAKEICFKNRLLSAYFSRGHLVPVIRGNGVYQRGMDWCLKLLNEGRWVHVFPEGWNIVLTLLGPIIMKSAIL